MRLVLKLDIAQTNKAHDKTYEAVLEFGCPLISALWIAATPKNRPIILKYGNKLKIKICPAKFKICTKKILVDATKVSFQS